MKVVVAGGGLVGSIAACTLAKQGHTVQLFELREDPKLANKIQARQSINLALSSRGRACLREIGLEETVLAHAIPMRGRLIHARDGSTKEFLYDPYGKECIWSVNRRYLNELLLDEAGNNPNIKIEFNHRVLEAELDTGTLKLKNEKTMKEISVSGDLLIGADGAHSTLRRSFLKRPMTNFSQTYIEHGYMELCIPPKSNGEHAMAKNNLHIWPRNEFMLIALPNIDGSYTATLFMPFDIFKKLDSSENIIRFFETEFPDALNAIGSETLVNDILSSKAFPLISIKCNPLCHGRTVILGDAAHAMVPFYGQGMNAGFEDVWLLNNLLKSSKLPLTKILEKFSDSRHEDAVAICELAMYNYVEMRSLVNKSSYFIRRIIDATLFKIFRNSWIPLYTSVSFTQIPYSQCIQNKKWQDETLQKTFKYLRYLSAASFIGSIYIWRQPIMAHFNVLVLNLKR